MTRAMIAGLALLVGASARGAPPPELAVDGPVLAPIKHQRFFRGERELFGYRPRFTPNSVTFDAANRPYMRVGVQEHGYSPSWKTTRGFVQTLDADGRWVRLDFTGAIRKRFPEWNGTFFSGTFAEERVAFDDAGDAYMVVNVSRSNLKCMLLLHSRDRCRTWAVHKLPYGWSRLETADGHNDTSRPPVVLVYSGWKGSKLLLIAPSQKPDGSLDAPAPVQVTPDDQARLSPMHSGLGNSSVTKGDVTFVAYLSAKPVPGREGTAQYVVAYNHKTRVCSKPVLMGVNGIGAPDVHNGPALAMDGAGVLHAVLGGHHDQFLYTRSVRPLDASQWTEPAPFGKPKSKRRQGSYTYPSLLCDRNDTLHVVGRFAGDRYAFCLDYLRKKPGRPWEDRGHLVEPFRVYYSCWYHKLALDRRGRLFLSYIYYGQQYGDAESAKRDGAGDEIAAYREKWPDEPIQLKKGSRRLHGMWEGVKAHDPAILMSDDGGDTWRLALTRDFVKGVR